MYRSAGPGRFFGPSHAGQRTVLRRGGGGDAGCYVVWSVLNRLRLRIDQQRGDEQLRCPGDRLLQHDSDHDLLRPERVDDDVLRGKRSNDHLLCSRSTGDDLLRSRAPTTTYYAPATPVTTYYAPTPVTTYYAPDAGDDLLRTDDGLLWGRRLQRPTTRRDDLCRPGRRASGPRSTIRASRFATSSGRYHAVVCDRRRVEEH